MHAFKYLCPNNRGELGEVMTYCPKCGTQVEENMTFCPRCGAPLKAEATVRAVQRNEKAEKQEKGEKQEKQEPEKSEKHEKGEFGFVGWLIGGLILIFLGLMSYLQMTGYSLWQFTWPFFFIGIGLIIIIGAVIAAKRNPKP